VALSSRVPGFVVFRNQKMALQTLAGDSWCSVRKASDSCPLKALACPSLSLKGYSGHSSPPPTWKVTAAALLRRRQDGRFNFW
jgi:hypothetical protein